MRRTRAAAMVALLGLIAAEGVGAQTLEEALVSAYLTNPTLEAQRAALRATDELVPQALSDWRPTLEGTVASQLSDVDNDVNSGSFNATSGALSVRQNLYQGGGTVANTNRAEQLVRLERSRLIATEQDVLLNAVEAYTDLLTALAVLDLSLQNENRLRRQLQATRDRFEVGEVTRTDVAQAEARLAGAVAERVRAEGTIQAARAAYRNVINQEPVRVVTPRPRADLPPTEADAQQLAETFNPNIAAAQFNLAAARADVRVAEADLLPELNVRGELSYVDEPNLTLDHQREATIGAVLRVPLYQGGGEYARVRQAKQTVRQRRDDLEAIFRAVREEVTSGWQTLVTARTAIESIREQVRAAEIALEGTRQEALVGQRTTLDVLDQENDLFVAQVDLVRAQRAEIVASHRVKAAIGQLTVPGLDLPVEPYDPEAYYLDVRNRLFGLGGRTDE
jgi:TolC family type I secretion outer membrane protein